MQPSLIQERFIDDPWKMMIVCILLNQTSRKQVEPLLDELFEKYPDAHAMAGAEAFALADTVRTCGLQQRRARNMIMFSVAWWKMEENADYESWPPPWHEIASMPGIGPYALDSYKYFVEAKIDLEMLSWDRKVREWLEEQRRVDIAWLA